MEAALSSTGCGLVNKAVDIGNVLLAFRPPEYLRGVGFGEKEVELYNGIVFGSSQWVDLDRGVIDEREAVAQLSAAYPDHARGIRQVFAGWYDMFTPLRGIELLRELKAAGYPVYALSNFHREAFAHVRSKHDWFGLFDGMVISYEVHAVKPEPEIYRELIDRYRIDPRESVFIDDVKENVDGARPFGFHTIHHTSFVETVRELRRWIGSRREPAGR